jgi:hypothetical protein
MQIQTYSHFQNIRKCFLVVLATVSSIKQETNLVG